MLSQAQNQISFIQFFSDQAPDDQLFASFENCI